MYGVIYVVKNKVNGKHYIGQTTQKWPKRKYQHIYEPQKCMIIDTAIQKYGKDNFEWTIIDEADSSTILDELECLYIAQYNSHVTNYGYNVQYGGHGIGKHSIESRRKMSKSHIGKKLSEAHRQKISENNGRGMLGKSPSKETRKKISISLSGKNHPRYGKTLSEEHKKKLSENNARARLGIKIGKYRGTSYSKKCRNPWTKVWVTRIRYNGHIQSLGNFNEPISGEIVYNIVFNEIYGGR